jgi:hypothetical protein
MLAVKGSGNVIGQLLRLDLPLFIVLEVDQTGPSVLAIVECSVSAQTTACIDYNGGPLLNRSSLGDSWIEA